MKHITVILGDPGSGKTVKAKQLCIGKKYMTVEDIVDKDTLEAIHNEKPQVLIFDGFDEKIETVAYAIALVQRPVRFAYAKEETSVKMPHEIIFVCQRLTEQDFKKSKKVNKLIIMEDWAIKKQIDFYRERSEVKTFS